MFLRRSNAAEVPAPDVLAIEVWNRSDTHAVFVRDGDLWLKWHWSKLVQRAPIAFETIRKANTWAPARKEVLEAIGLCKILPVELVEVDE